PSTHVERARRLPEVVPDAEPLTTERIRRELALQSQNRFRRRPRRERRISLRPLLPVVRISISISAELDPRRIAQRPRPRLSAHPGESLRRVIRSRWRADEDRQPEQAGVHRRELSVERLVRHDLRLIGNDHVNAGDTSTEATLTGTEQDP